MMPHGTCKHKAAIVTINAAKKKKDGIIIIKTVIYLKISIFPILQNQICHRGGWKL